MDEQEWESRAADVGMILEDLKAQAAAIAAQSEKHRREMEAQIGELSARSGAIIKTAQEQSGAIIKDAERRLDSLLDGAGVKVNNFCDWSLLKVIAWWAVATLLGGFLGALVYARLLSPEIDPDQLWPYIYAICERFDISLN